MIFELIGIASALLFFVGDIPYLTDTIKGRTMPHRVTWGVVAILNAIGFANQLAYGATSSLWLFGAGALMTGLIFLASFRNGTGGKSKTDILCLAVALAGVALWLLFRSPLYSVLANIVADVAALWPTFIKARHHPETETRIAWLIGTISVILDAIAVGRLSWHLLLLPVTSALLQGYMVYLLYVHAKPSKKTAKSIVESVVPL